jgi:uncharacterized membrane protein
MVGASMVQFLGHLHPVLVHLPIGGWFFVALLELLSFWRGFGGANRSNAYLVALSAGFGVVSAACGWCLAASGDYTGSTLAWHRWLGAGVAAMMCLTCLGRWVFSVGWYRLFLGATLALLVVAGHFGGVLTHGEGFLGFRASAAGSNSGALAGLAADWENRDVTTQVVLPILRQRCADCHGAGKQKGGLRLDSIEGIMAGGGSGETVLPGFAQSSLLLRRMLLPLDLDEHMPPEARAQPSAAELAVIRWWIDAGAPTNRTVQSLKPGPEVARQLATAVRLIK